MQVSNLKDELCEVLRTLRARTLFVMRLSVRKLQIVGATPGGAVAYNVFEVFIYIYYLMHATQTTIII
jgi:hypothetical protein